MTNSGAPIGILLGAGLSRRFGSADKLLHVLPDGRAIALAAAQHLLQALPRSIAVIQPDNAPLDRLLRDAGMQVLHCASGGMGDSIAAAMRACEQLPPHSGYVITLADMPYLRPQTITMVAAALDTALIAAPVYQGQRGHPVAFSASLREELLALHGDEGARWILHRHREELQLLDCDDAGVLADIDTPADLKAD